MTPSIVKYLQSSFIDANRDYSFSPKTLYMMFFSHQFYEVASTSFK